MVYWYLLKVAPFYFLWSQNKHDVRLEQLLWLMIFIICFVFG